MPCLRGVNFKAFGAQQETPFRNDALTRAHAAINRHKPIHFRPRSHRALNELAGTICGHEYNLLRPDSLHCGLTGQLVLECHLEGGLAKEPSAQPGWFACSDFCMRSIALLSFALMLLTLTLDKAPACSAPAAQRAKRKTEGERPAQDEAVAEAGATSLSRLALPFKRSWQYLTDGVAPISATLDGERVYLPLVDGRLISLDRETGSLLWSSEPGGMITAPIAVSEKAAYVATRKVSQDGSESGGRLQALDKATGLTLWSRDYARPFTSPLVLAADRIYVGSADGALYALSANDGSVLWKVQTQDVVRGRALVTENTIYFGSDDGALRAVKPDNGAQVWRFQTAGRILGQPVSDGHAIYFGSGDGYVYSVAMRTGKLRWRLRTGAAIEASPALAADHILVASFDNFVYALSRANGNRVWKRRLDNRLASAPIVDGDAVMIAPLRGNHVAVFLNSDGRRVNYYQLDRGSEIIADPVFSDGTLLLVTDKGLVAATAGPAENQADALKKNAHKDKPELLRRYKQENQADALKKNAHR
jgi:outer membrane protein assembly factor BamB